MPKRKYTPYKKGFKKEYTSSYSMKPSSKAVESYVKKLINSEKEIKFVSTQIVNPIATGGGVQYLTTIAIGTNDAAQRIGSKVKLYSIQMKGHLTKLNSIDETITVRILLVIDWENAGALPTIPQLFATIASCAANQNRLGNSVTYKRFTVLSDEFYLANSGSLNVAGTGFSDISIPLRDYYKSQKTEVTFRGTTNGVASAAEGALFLITVSEGSNVTCLGDVMVKYTDV